MRKKNGYTYLFYFIFCFLGLHLRHIEVPRRGVKLELQLLAYTTATAMSDPSCICDLHHSSGQCQILNSLSEAIDPTCNLMGTSQIHFHCATMGTPIHIFYVDKESTLFLVLWVVFVFNNHEYFFCLRYYGSMIFLLQPVSITNYLVWLQVI